MAELTPQEQEELDRLRKMKRVRELEAQLGGQAQPAAAPIQQEQTGGVGVFDRLGAVKRGTNEFLDDVQSSRHTPSPVIDTGINLAAGTAQAFLNPLDTVKEIGGRIVRVPANASTAIGTSGLAAGAYLGGDKEMAGIYGRSALQHGQDAALGGLEVATLGKGGLASRATPKKQTVRTPEIDDLYARKNLLYGDVDNAGVSFSGDQLDEVAANINREIPQSGLGGITSKVHPITKSTLGNLKKAEGQPATLTELDSFRSFAGAAQRGTPDAFHAGNIRRKVDDFIENTTPATGPRNTDVLIAKARNAHKRLRKSEDVDEALYGGSLNAPTTAIGAGRDVAGQRRAIRSILKSKKKRANYTPEEIAQMELVVRQPRRQRAAAWVGQSAPTNIVSKAGGIGIGASVGGFVGGPVGAVVGGVGVPVVGQIGKNMADNMAQKSIDDLVRLVRAGTKQKAIKKALTPAQKAANLELQRRRARALVAAGSIEGMSPTNDRFIKTAGGVPR